MRIVVFVAATAILVAVPRARLYGQSAMAQVRLALPTSRAAQQTTGAAGAAPGASNPVTLSAVGSTEGDQQQPAVGTRNPYVGAQAGYVFGEGDFASNLVANGSVVYNVLEINGKTKAGKGYGFFLPVRGNISSLVAASDQDARDKAGQKLISGAQGMRVAVEPYIALPAARFLQPALMASIGWKLNSVKDANDTTRYLSLGRFSAGAELAIGPADGSRNPIVLSVSPVYSVFATRDYQKVNGLKRSIMSGEFTVVVPLGTSVGLLTEAVFARQTTPAWRTGVILTAASK